MESTGGGGPAPFLLKTYDMVDDSSTDDIVSWSSRKNSFVVWNPPEFARLLLPTYFKHNNFSSFIRQLNTYGFRKIDPERWEFANEEFIKDQKHLLKNIHRRKPIHSHSHPPGSLVDPERAALEEKIENLAHEKASLEANVSECEQQRSAAKHQLEDLTQRVNSMEQRQENLLSFFKKAVQDPKFVEHLACNFESMDFAAYTKKRKIPQAEDCRPLVESSFVDNQNSSRLEFGNVIPDFSNKLRLELSPASDVILVSHSTHSSNGDGESPPRKVSEEEPKEAHARTPGLLFAPETLELSDTGTSYTFKVDSPIQRKFSVTEDPGLNLLGQDLTSNEEAEGHISCHLNLTLASSLLQINKGPQSTRTPQPCLDIDKSPESRFDGSGKEYDVGDVPKNRNLREERTLSSSQEAQAVNQGPPAAPGRVNDLFWEQFLTERPGSSDNEEANSNCRANPRDNQDDRISSQGLSRNAKSMERLTL